jgi:hypothetical protein
MITLGYFISIESWTVTKKRSYHAFSRKISQNCDDDLRLFGAVLIEKISS